MGEPVQASPHPPKPAFPTAPALLLARRRAFGATAVGLLILAGITRSGWRAARGELQMFSPPGSAPSPPSGVAVEPVAWTAAGTRIAGWYVPSRNRAAVILTPGSSADRSQLN